MADGRETEGRGARDTGATFITEFSLDVPEEGGGKGGRGRAEHERGGCEARDIEREDAGVKEERGGRGAGERER